jgi:hypothetical protein
MPSEDTTAASEDSKGRVPAVEARMADLVLQFTDEVSRAKMQTFLHFAKDRSKISMHVEPSRDHGLRFILAYPFTCD